MGPLTFEEFKHLPEKPGKDELLEGEWFYLPPAFRNHRVIVHRIFGLLTRFLDVEDRVSWKPATKLETGTG